MTNTAERPVTASDVREVKFQLIRRGGYDPGQVDPFLEVVAQTLEGGPYADNRIDAEYIHGVRFTTVRRGGYLPAQVDAFLDRVIDTFASAGRTELHPVAAAPPPQPVAPVEPPVFTPLEDFTPSTAPAQPAPMPVAEIPAPAAAVAAPPAPSLATAPIAVDHGDASPEADFERLRALHRSGVVSDKEFAVLGARVKRRINAAQPGVNVS